MQSGYCAQLSPRPWETTFQKDQSCPLLGTFLCKGRPKFRLPKSFLALTSSRWSHRETDPAAERFIRFLAGTLRPASVTLIMPPQLCCTRHFLSHLRGQREFMLNKHLVVIRNIFIVVMGLQR